MFFEWISDNVYGHKKSRGGLGRFQKLITTRRDPIRIGRFCQCVKLLWLTIGFGFVFDKIEVQQT